MTCIYTNILTAGKGQRAAAQAAPTAPAAPARTRLLPVRDMAAAAENFNRLLHETG